MCDRENTERNVVACKFIAAWNGSESNSTMSYEALPTYIRTETSIFLQVQRGVVCGERCVFEGGGGIDRKYRRFVRGVDFFSSNFRLCRIAFSTLLRNIQSKNALHQLPYPFYCTRVGSIQERIMGLGGWRRFTFAQCPPLSPPTWTQGAVVVAGEKWRPPLVSQLLKANDVATAARGKDIKTPRKKKVGGWVVGWVLLSFQRHSEISLPLIYPLYSFQPVALKVVTHINCSTLSYSL